MASLLKVLGGEEGRLSSTSENSRKKTLQEKFDGRKCDLSARQCQTSCFLLPSPDLTLIYVPNDQQNQWLSTLWFAKIKYVSKVQWKFSKSILMIVAERHEFVDDWRLEMNYRWDSFTWTFVDKAKNIFQNLKMIVHFFASIETINWKVT